MAGDWQAGLHVVARDLPIPDTISAEARAIMARPQRPMPDFPDLGDRQGWRDYTALSDAMMLPVLQGWAAKVPAAVEDRVVNGVTVYDVRPADIEREDDGILYFDIHGGGFLGCGGACCRAQAQWVAGDVRRRVWSVDYRVPPDHPYPDPLDDCVAAYRGALERWGPSRIVVGGASAGANLAAALVLRARAAGLPLPGALVLHTPALDLTWSNDSWTVNDGVDAVLSGEAERLPMVYAGDADPADPFVSPLFGDVAGFPPTFLSAGTRDRLLSCAVLMHARLRAADVDAELHIIEAGSHGGFHDAPEEAHINREVRKFIARVMA